MNTPTRDLYRSLDEIHARPAPFSRYTADVLWSDEHIARNMLAFHLDPDSAPASRPHEFIARSTTWIADRFGLAQGKRVADFGCGPGLYTLPWAEAGARVTGIDISPVSVAHAKGQAQEAGLDIDYVEANYLDYEPNGLFDLVTLIYCDLCPLSPTQRRQLLTTFRDSLADGGSILVDAFTMRAYGGRSEASEHSQRLMHGFWAPGDYWGFLDTFKYDQAKVVLDKYTIVEPHRVRTIYNWLQYFTLDQLKAEFAQCGLQVVECYGDVAGAPAAAGDVVAVIARKA